MLPYFYLKIIRQHIDLSIFHNTSYAECSVKPPPNLNDLLREECEIGKKMKQNLSLSSPIYDTQVNYYILSMKMKNLITKNLKLSDFFRFLFYCMKVS